MQSHSKSKSDWNHNFIYKLQLTSFATTLNLCILTQAYPLYFKLRQILREKKNNKQISYVKLSSVFPSKHALSDFTASGPLSSSLFPFQHSKVAATDKKSPRIITLLLKHHPQDFAFSNSCKEVKVLQTH